MSDQIAKTGSGAIERITLVAIRLLGIAVCAQGVAKVAASGQ